MLRLYVNIYELDVNSQLNTIKSVFIIFFIKNEKLGISHMYTSVGKW